MLVLDSDALLPAGFDVKLHDGVGVSPASTSVHVPPNCTA